MIECRRTVSGRPGWERLLGFLLAWMAGVVLTVLLAHLGKGVLAAPPLLQPHRIPAWYDRRGGVVATFASARTILFGVGCYLCVLWPIVVVVRVLGAACVQRALPMCRLPGSGTMLRLAMGASIAGVAIVATTGSASAALTTVGASNSSSTAPDSGPDLAPVLRYAGPPTSGAGGSPPTGPPHANPPSSAGVAQPPTLAPVSGSGGSSSAPPAAPVGGAPTAVSRAVPTTGVPTTSGPANGVPTTRPRSSGAPVAGAPGCRRASCRRASCRRASYRRAARTLLEDPVPGAGGWHAAFRQTVGDAERRTHIGAEFGNRCDSRARSGRPSGMARAARGQPVVHRGDHAHRSLGSAAARAGPRPVLVASRRDQPAPPSGSRRPQPSLCRRLGHPSTPSSSRGMRGCPHPVGHEGQTVDSAPKVRHHDQHRHRFGCGVVPRGHHHGRRRRPLFRLHPSTRRQRGRADRRPVEQHTPRFDECHHPADRPGPNHPTGRNLAIDPAAGRHDRYDPRRDDADVRPGAGRAGSPAFVPTHLPPQLHPSHGSGSDCPADHHALHHDRPAWSPTSRVALDVAVRHEGTERPRGARLCCPIWGRVLRRPRDHGNLLRAIPPGPMTRTLLHGALDAE